MKIWTTIRSSLELLTSRDRRALILVSVAQMSTSLLDLLGVLLIGIVSALSVASISDSSPPVMVSNLLDFFGLGEINQISLSLWLALIAGFVLILKSGLNIAITRKILRFLANRQAIVAGSLAVRLLSKPLLQVLNRSSQMTAYALTNAVNVATLVVLAQAIVMVSEFSLLALLTLGLVLVSPLVALFSLLFFLLIAILQQRLISGWVSRLGIAAQETEVASTELIQESLKSYREVTITSRRSFYIERFQSLRWDAAKVQADLQFLGLIPKYVFEIALVIGAGLLAVSQVYTKNLSAAVSVIAVFLVAGSRILPSLMRLVASALAIRGAAGQAEPAYALNRELTDDDLSMNRRSTFISTESAKELNLDFDFDDFDASVVVSDLTFTYPMADKPALSNISLEIRQGQSLALVGTSGAGKSTLADAILGVVNGDFGGVTIGGLHPLDAIAKWPGAIGYVPQDVSMVNGTVLQNVALGIPDNLVDPERAKMALAKAKLSDFLEVERDGLLTVIGEHGLKLSGGQRQRLGLARALYSNPKLLVLDEATSALDAETENSISETIAALEGTVTTITVAHRISTVRHCDVVAYLEMGKISAIGSFEEVRLNSAAFDRQAQLFGL